MTQETERLASAGFKQRLAQCIHCGMCLQACPTYVVTGTELDGPRGRIALMRAASEAAVSPEVFETTFTEHIDLCLACRSCETACPSGVRYGSLVEDAREVIAARRKTGPAERFAYWLGLRQMLPHVGRLKLMARLLWFYEASGVQRLVRRTQLLPRQLQAMEAILPPISPHYDAYRGPAPAIGEHRGDVAFFVGCIQEAFLSPVNQATVRVLQRNGYTVHFPAGQTCCGAAQLHVGGGNLARELARRNIDAFLGGEYLAIISNAGGCGATLRDEYPGLLAEDPAYAERAARFAGLVQDISEFLAQHLHVPPAGTVQARATYSDSCHLRHVQKVSAQPRDLLRAIPGLELVELSYPDRCCGSAGIYNITHPDMADAVLDLKLADIAATGADLVVTSNAGCQMQLIAGVRRAGLTARVRHVVEVLEMSYQNQEGQP
jgi:glycolate oxidase iron-sulfur subunit